MKQVKPIKVKTLSVDTGLGQTTQKQKVNYIALAISLLVPLFLLVPVQINVKPPMILAERFWHGGGWIEIAILEIYSLTLTYIILYKEKIKNVRIRYWVFFSVIFFLQLFLGLTVSEKFLMSGKLHLPIPALIIADPIYRGGGSLFMPILVLSTIAFLGPAWCSHLCYIGAWDGLLSRHKKKPKPFSRKFSITFRYVMLVGTILVAVVMNRLGVPIVTATFIAILFGILSLALMFLVSWRFGYMFHCTTFCPIGSLITLLSKLYPARIRINHNTCTFCNLCTLSCRYNALSPNDIKKGKAGWNCTLCGDCIDSCHDGAIYLSFFGSKKNAWEYYIAAVIGVHTVFLALARI